MSTGFKPWASGDIFIAVTDLNNPADDHAGIGHIRQYGADLVLKADVSLSQTSHLVGGLKFDRHGVLIEAPVAMPDGLRSPNNPFLALGGPATHLTSRGIEAMAISTDRRYLYAALEGATRGRQRHRRARLPTPHLRVQPPGPPLHRPPVGVPHPHRREHGL